MKTTPILSDEYVVFGLPFLDNFNDYMEIYLKRNSDDTIVATDDGYSIGSLASAGFDISEGSVLRSALDEIASEFEVEIKDEDISMTSSMDVEGIIRAMSEAMLAVNCLVIGRNP